MDPASGFTYESLPASKHPSPLLLKHFTGLSRADCEQISACLLLPRLLTQVQLLTTDQKLPIQWVHHLWPNQSATSLDDPFPCSLGLADPAIPPTPPPRADADRRGFARLCRFAVRCPPAIGLVCGDEKKQERRPSPRPSLLGTVFEPDLSVRPRENRSCARLAGPQPIVFQYLAGVACDWPSREVFDIYPWQPRDLLTIFVARCEPLC